MARGGEDVSLGKTFGDTPPPGKVPILGFITHMINYCTLARCWFWRSHGLSINVLSRSLINVTTLYLTNCTGPHSSSFMLCLSSLWARYSVLKEFWSKFKDADWTCGCVFVQSERSLSTAEPSDSDSPYRCKLSN